LRRECGKVLEWEDGTSGFDAGGEEAEEKIQAAKDEECPGGGLDEEGDAVGEDGSSDARRKRRGEGGGSKGRGTFSF
jgi:hypothetical protein